MMNNNSSEQDLRAQLAAAINPSHQNNSSGNNQSAAAHVYNAANASHIPLSASASPHSHEHRNLDPAIAGGAQVQGMMNHQNNHSGEDDEIGAGGGGKGGKRELSQSKRAAQNRAAQRAFRQRKEGYIKKLEEQVREFNNLEESFKSIQTENYSLREYIIHLQSRLIESQGEFPQPPPNVNLAHPGRADPSGTIQMPTHHGDVGGASASGMGLGAGAPTAPMGVAAMSSLQQQASQAQQSGVPAKRSAEGQAHAYMNASGPSQKRMRDDGRDQQQQQQAPNELSRLVTGHDGLPTTLSM